MENKMKYDSKCVVKRDQIYVYKMPGAVSFCMFLGNDLGVYKFIKLDDGKTFSMPYEQIDCGKTLDTLTEYFATADKFVKNQFNYFGLVDVQRGAAEVSANLKGVLNIENLLNTQESINKILYTKSKTGDDYIFLTAKDIQRKASSIGGKDGSMTIHDIKNQARDERMHGALHLGYVYSPFAGDGRDHFRDMKPIAIDNND